MKLKSLVLEYQGLKRNIKFGEKTLIHSFKNSSGKSTLLRLIFFSMGYNIPQTKGINFRNVKTSLFIDNQNQIKEIKRLNNNLTLIYRDDSKSDFFLPDDQSIILSQLWYTDNLNVLNNLLGAIYMDQEKGWTLLNRGTVIGSIKFKIEEFLEGISNRDLAEQKIQLENINLELKKYKQILSVIEYKSHLAEIESNSIFSSDYTSKLESDLNLLFIKKSELEYKVEEIVDSIKENIKFIEFIEKMNLVVKDSETGVSIQVNKSNIVHFSENQRYIETRLLILKNELSKVKNQIRKLELDLQKTNSLFSLQSEIEKIDHLISKVNLPYQQIERTIQSLEKQKKQLNKEIKDKISINNTVINSLHKNILKYAKVLEVDQFINSNKDYIFTSDLKSLSGAVLHKIVFSFKMAYIIELQNFLGYKVPIILDSPSGRELDQVNIEETLKILENDFSENQIVISSINEFDKFNYDEKNELKGRLFEENGEIHLT